MHTLSNPPMGTGWRKRLADKAARDEARNDPALLARRAESQARIQAERQEQDRLAAEAQARIAADMVTFPAMPTKLAAELIMAFERYRSAGREATPAEIEAVSHMVQGLNPHPGSPVIRLTYGLQMPVPVSGVPATAVETLPAQNAPVSLDNVPQKPSKGKREPDVLLDGQFLIED